MNNKCSCFSYGNVDDLIFDTSYRIIDGIIYSAKTWSNIEDVEIPEEKKDEWQAKLWNFDVTQWKPRSDDRAFPNTKYDNRLKCILECKAYDLKDEIMEYLKAHKGNSDEEEEEIFITYPTGKIEKVSNLSKLKKITKPTKEVIPRQLIFSLLGTRSELLKLKKQVKRIKKYIKKKESVIQSPFAIHSKYN
jgi:glutamyl/glutaminyl-tRNA synthetase